ncbi:SGNH/GDSL hydrolase family protein [Candidatus Omnitrophota bacterium]
MQKRSVTNILISALSVCLVLGIAEAVMRLAWRMSGWVERPIYQRSANPYLRYELVPDTELGVVSVNSDGFRGQEYRIEKPAGTFRIIMLGDSETLSLKLKEKDSLAGQLEALLDQQPGAWDYQVLNFGVEGYNTFQELEQLKDKGLKYSPDLLILNYVFNDPEPGEYYFNKTLLMRHSALVRYFTYRIKKASIRRERKRLGVGTELDNLYYLHQEKFFGPVRSAILETADIAASLGGKLVVVIFSESGLRVKDFKENYPYRPLHKLIKSIESKRIIFIDLIDEFDRLGMGPQDVSIDYIAGESHKNASALGVAASRILKVLKANKLIPG